MSGSIFGDDDDFELVGGSDTPSAIRKPPTATPAASRPVAPRTPSIPAPASGENKNTDNRKLPATGNASALPRPVLSSPTSKAPVVRNPPVASEPVKNSPVSEVPKRPLSGRSEAPKIIKPAVSERVVRDTPQQRESPVIQKPPVAAPAYEPQPKDTPEVATSSRYPEREISAPDNAQNSRRSLRNESNARIDASRDNEIDERFADRRFADSSSHEEFTPPQLRDENPKNLYTQKPYVPAESPRAAPSRIEQPVQPEQSIQSYPESNASPVVKQTNQASKPARAVRVPKEKKSKADSAKGPGNFSGGRSGVVVVRVFAIAVVAMLMLAGGKSVFFPTTIPDPTTITNVVKKRLGVTNFPAENGQAFVTSFARLYFTVDPANPNSSDVYTPYMSSSLASSMTASSGASAKQTITEGPVISGVKSVDDSNAIYTVGAKLSNGNWMYVDIPVYYDSDKVGFAISGMPAFAPAPAKITAPLADSPFTHDPKLGDSIRTSVMEQFFPAWASSNTAGINLVVLEKANSEAKIGLNNSVKFVSIQDFTVELKQPGDADENIRKAQATIVWASSTDAKITYTQQYNLVLLRQPDNRWYIKELTSGVRS